MILVFGMLSFRPAFSLSSFTFIRRLFSSSSLFAIRVESSAYLRLLIFLPTILIRACASSSLAFHIIYSAFKLNKQSDNIQARYTFLNLRSVRCSMSCSNCCFLILYRFLRMQVSSIQFSSVAQSCPALCDPVDCSTSSPRFPVHHHLLELAQTHPLSQ